MTTTATDADATSDEDPQATVLSLLLQATGALARAGDADRACRIAASAWAAVRETRPDLATKVTAALHGLARRVDAAAPAGSSGQGTGEAPASDPDLDVRELRPAQRHPGTGPELLRRRETAGGLERRNCDLRHR
ncbi:MAG: hypothetical protein ACRDNW_24740 [Trebonia sp.]